MGTYLDRFWQPDGGGMTKTERMGGPYHPYSPDVLSALDISLSPSCANAVATAQQSLSQLDKYGTLTDTEPLARLLLRAEAVSSSRIEGLEMPAGKLLEYEELDRLGIDHRLDGTEAQVLGNLHALVEAVDDIAEKETLTTDDICALHVSLLKGTRLEQYGGIVRDSQNWVGGNRVNPVGAAYVPPEPGEVPALLEDLVTFANTSELPAVALAAVVHAQFETIHPFIDGNGRVGRALIHVILRHAKVARVTVPPVSLVLATDKERYIANLMAWRTGEGEDKLAAANNWIEYFANTLSLACERAEAFENDLGQIRASWLEKTNFRAGSAGRQLIDILPGTPAISVKTAQALTGKSYPAALSAVKALEEAGILQQNAKNRKSGIYVANDVLMAFNRYERSLATLSGDTAAEKPRRNVPQKQRN